MPKPSLTQVLLKSKKDIVQNCTVFINSEYIKKMNKEEIEIMIKKKMRKCENCNFVYNLHQYQLSLGIHRKYNNGCPSCGSSYYSNIEINYSFCDQLSDLIKGYKKNKNAKLQDR